MSFPLTETMQRIRFGYVSTIPDQVHLYVWRLSITFMYPAIFYRKTSGEFGFQFPTTLLVHTQRNWKWGWTAALRVLGFGFGLCWDWVENPFRRIENPYRKEVQ